MRELDFDMFFTYDAGKSFYRGLFIYAGLYMFKNYSVSNISFFI